MRFSNWRICGSVVSLLDGKQSGMAYQYSVNQELWKLNTGNYENQINSGDIRVR